MSYMCIRLQAAAGLSHARCDLKDVDEIGILTNRSGEFREFQVRVDEMQELEKYSLRHSGLDLESSNMNVFRIPAVAWE